MPKIDERIARCFGMLRSPEFKPLLTYLEETRAEDLERLVQAQDDVFVRRYQGKAERMKELLEYIRDADTLLAKLKR